MRLDGKVLLTGALLAVLGSAVAAQPGPGGFQMPPAMRAKMQAWQKWRDSHKHVGELQRTIMGMSRFEQDPKTKFTKDQAKKILPVIRQNQNKPKLTDDQALKVQKAITAPLNVAQLKALAAAPQFGRGGRGGPGGGGPGGPGGRGPGAGGPRPGGPGGGGGFDPSRIPDPQDYNPLNPSTMPFAKASPQMGQRLKQSMDSMVARLAALAKQK